MEKLFYLIRNVSRLLITNLALLGMAGSNIVSASDLTAKDIEVAATNALSRMKPVQIRTNGEAIPFNVSTDKAGGSMEDDFRVVLASQPPMLSRRIQALHLANGIDGIQSCIVESLPYIEARLGVENALRPQPTLDSSRQSLTKGEFENQRQFEERVSQKYAEILTAWNAREKDVSAALAKHSDPWHVLIPGLNREVETIPVVFHAVPSPQLFESLAQQLFAGKARIDRWELPRFDAETLRYRDASFSAFLFPTTSDLQLDMIGSESLNILVKDVAQAQNLKRACENGSALISAQALPILARVLGGKSRGHTSYKFLVFMFDIRFLDGANDGQPYEGVTVTLDEPKLDSAENGNEERDAFYLKLSKWLIRN